MSIVSRAQKAAHAATKRLRPEVVTYSGTRDAVGFSISVERGVRGRTDWLNESPNPNTRAGGRSTSWLLTVEDLTKSGTVYRPERGDKITVAATGEVFEVMPAGKDAPLWEWHDRSGQTIRRIHTRQRGTV